MGISRMAEVRSELSVLCHTPLIKRFSRPMPLQQFYIGSYRCILRLAFASRFKALAQDRL